MVLTHTTDSVGTTFTGRRKDIEREVDTGMRESRSSRHASRPSTESAILEGSSSDYFGGSGGGSGTVGAGSRATTSPATPHQAHRISTLFGKQNNGCDGSRARNPVVSKPRPQGNTINTSTRDPAKAAAADGGAGASTSASTGLDRVSTVSAISENEDGSESDESGGGTRDDTYVPGERLRAESRESTVLSRLGLSVASHQEGPPIGPSPKQGGHHNDDREYERASEVHNPLSRMAQRDSSDAVVLEDSEDNYCSDEVGMDAVGSVDGWWVLGGDQYIRTPSTFDYFPTTLGS